METSVCLDVCGVNVGVADYTVVSSVTASVHRLSGLLFRA